MYCIPRQFLKCIHMPSFLSTDNISGTVYIYTHIFIIFFVRLSNPSTRYHLSINREEKSTRQQSVVRCKVVMLIDDFDSVISPTNEHLLFSFREQNMGCTPSKGHKGNGVTDPRIPYADEDADNLEVFTVDIYDQKAIAQLKRDFKENLDMFLLNNILMSVMFFENYEL